MQGDECLDGPCFQTKIGAHIDRELAARPELVQIENGWTRTFEQRPGAVQRGHFREIEALQENPDAEPVSACAAAIPAIILYGKGVGTTLTVCTDNNCPVHDPRAAARQAQQPAPTLAQAPEQETDEEAEERKQQYEQQQREYRGDAGAEAGGGTARAGVRGRTRPQGGAEADPQGYLRAHPRACSRNLSPAQLRMLLRALVNLDPYTFADDVAEEIAGGDDNDQRTAEETLLAAMMDLGTRG